MGIKIRTIVLVVILAAVVFLLGRMDALAEVVTCQSCHNNEVFRASFGTSVHGNIGCESCHTDLRNLEAHITRSEKASPVNCTSCHEKVVGESFHAPHQNFSCTECHQEIHTLKDARANVSADIPRKCDSCHAQSALTTAGQVNRQSTPDRGCQNCHNDGMLRVQFETSVHGTNGCTSCHTDIRDLDAHRAGKEKPLPVNCGRCHQKIIQEFNSNFHAIQK